MDLLDQAHIDVGEWDVLKWTDSMKRVQVMKGLPPMPNSFPKDSRNRNVSPSTFSYSLANGEKVLRDWLVWSESKEAFFCFSCLLFSNQAISVRPKLSCPGIGFSHTIQKHGWKKLLDNIKEHQEPEYHKKFYMDWKMFLLNQNKASSIDVKLIEQRKTEVMKWRNILKRYIDCLLFLARQTLAIRGADNTLIGKNKGNFLTLLELLAKYDPFLNNHLQEIKKANAEEKPIVSYLSGTIQNELLALCGEKS